jgi:hypothetical protein
MSEPGFAPRNDNGRVSGGSAGPEHRYSFPAVDCARHDEARYGSVDEDSRWGGESERVPESEIGTMGRPQRGALGGKSLPDDRGGFT